MRRHYVVTYDISDDKRRSQVFKTLYGFGDHAQYSVFFCELTEQELVRLRSTLRALINHFEDQILFVDFGRATRSLDHRLDVLGKAYVPPSRCLVV